MNERQTSDTDVTLKKDSAPTAYIFSATWIASVPLKGRFRAKTQCPLSSRDGSTPTPSSCKRRNGEYSG